jgi:hypothetical protein
VKQRCSGATGHSSVAIGSAGYHTLAESQHASQLRLTIQRRDEVHFGCSRVGEADAHIVRQKHVGENIGPVHAR